MGKALRIAASRAVDVLQHFIVMLGAQLNEDDWKAANDAERNLREAIDADREEERGDER